MGTLFLMLIQALQHIFGATLSTGFALRPVIKSRYSRLDDQMFNDVNWPEPERAPFLSKSVPRY